MDLHLRSSPPPPWPAQKSPRSHAVPVHQETMCKRDTSKSSKEIFQAMDDKKAEVEEVGEAVEEGGKGEVKQEAEEVVEEEGEKKAGVIDELDGERSERGVSPNMEDLVVPRLKDDHDKNDVNAIAQAAWIPERGDSDGDSDIDKDHGRLDQGPGGNSEAVHPSRNCTRPLRCPLVWASSWLDMQQTTPKQQSVFDPRWFVQSSLESSRDSGLGLTGSTTSLKVKKKNVIVVMAIMMSLLLLLLSPKVLPAPPLPTQLLLPAEVQCSAPPRTAPTDLAELIVRWDAGAEWETPPPPPLFSMGKGAYLPPCAVPRGGMESRAVAIGAFKQVAIAAAESIRKVCWSGNDADALQYLEAYVAAVIGDAQQGVLNQHGMGRELVKMLTAFWKAKTKRPASAGGECRLLVEEMVRWVEILEEAEMDSTWTRTR
ncbi:hypothetical protein AC578_9857 [Pseudocercospora eumusae]|uniref:Uncharacterized protein n=1 Tax=Pseudocercospora eumusae TaxID=321146 RepID=A0A139HB06_9PEZI|nr:hypothetical protein AC578_9857 [Pseudocercospora eumusae]